MNKIWLIAFLTTLLPFQALATESDFKFSGKLETFGAGYFERSPSKENAFGEARLLPKINWTPNENWRLILEGDFRVDTNDIALGFIDRQTEKDHRWFIDVRESYLEYKDNNLRIRTGKQIFEWSVTDTVSPSDNLNPRDWLDFVKVRDKIGVPSTSLKFGNDTFIETVFVPWLTNSRLPSGTQRWSKELTANIDYLPAKDYMDYEPQFGTRIGTNINGFDLGASYYEGFSYSPHYQLLPTSSTTARLRPIHHSEKVIATTMAKSLGVYNLRSEVGYFEQKTSDNFLQVVVGVDREWTDVWNETDSLYVLLQSSKSFITKDHNSVAGTYDFRRVLDDAIMCKIKYTPSDSSTWSWGAEGSYNFAKHDWFIEPNVAKKFGSSVSAKLAMDFMGGPDSSFFGGYNNNNRATVVVTWFF